MTPRAFNAIRTLIIPFAVLNVIHCSERPTVPGLVYQVSEGDFKTCCTASEKNHHPLPPIYCYAGNKKRVINVFKSVTVDLIIGKTDNLTLYQGNDSREVEEHIISDHAKLSWNKVLSYIWKRKEFNLDPFNPSCFSIKTDIGFEIKVHSVELDNRRLAMFITGLFLFGYSSLLSRNSLFYYLFGITIGVIVSFVIIIVLINRLIPQKKFIFGLLGLSLFGVKVFFENLNVILTLHFNYLLGYIFFSMFVSFIVCYRYGPVTNLRSIDLIRWTLQLIGLTLVTFSSNYLEAMVIVDVLIIYSYKYLSISTSKSNSRLLSEDQYIQQALIFSTKALGELQKYHHVKDSEKTNGYAVIEKLLKSAKYKLILAQSQSKMMQIN